MDELAREAEIANANARTAGLALQLEMERQKCAPRRITDQQRATMIEELRGKILKINLVVQRDLESEWFAFQLENIFHEAGVASTKIKLPAGETLSIPAGLMMYCPHGLANEPDLKNDPLYLALKKTDLFGGTAGRPWFSLEDVRLDSPTLPTDEYAIYVGQKLPQ